MPTPFAPARRLVAVLLCGVACLASYGCGSEASSPPRIVSPSRPQALPAEPPPATLHDALEALDRGLSGRDFQAMQILDEEDAVAATYPVARWMQQAWLQPDGSTLRTALASAGFAEVEEMSDAILRSFWRALHRHPIDLDGQAVQAEVRRREALRAPRAAVFPADIAATLVDQCSRAAPGPVSATWTVDGETIRRLEEALIPALQDALDRQQAITGWQWKSSDYYRQYGGLVVNGQRVVYVNGFHQQYLEMRHGAPGEWRRRAVAVCDGGRNFFGAVYNPATGRIVSLRFN